MPTSLRDLVLALIAHLWDAGKKCPEQFNWVESLSQCHRAQLSCELFHEAGKAMVWSELNGATDAWRGVKTLLSNWRATTILLEDKTLAARVQAFRQEKAKEPDTLGVSR